MWKPSFNLEQNIYNTLYILFYQIESQRQAVVRQSAAAILEASADEKLQKAFQNIEDLSKKLGDAEAQLKLKVSCRWKEGFDFSLLVPVEWMLSVSLKRLDKGESKLLITIHICCYGYMQLNLRNNDSIWLRISYVYLLDKWPQKVVTDHHSILW